MHNKGDTMILRNKVDFNGWIRAIRKSKTVTFIQASDGKHDTQIVTPMKSVWTVGSAIHCIGNTQIHNGKPELHAEKITLISKCDSLKYPLQNKRHTLEFLRKYPHLNSRRIFHNTILQFRDFLSLEISNYFHAQDFLNVHTPILTSNDCEGAGETLNVKNDMFNAKPYMTVSAQLHLEAIGAGFKNVYTLSPCFRAEKTLSSKHLAEFYMLEVEMHFLDDINSLMDFVENLFLFLVQKSNEFMKNKAEKLGTEVDFYFEEKKFDKIERITYDDAFDRLSKAKRYFETPLKYGDLSSEHEQCLVELMEGPTFVTHYPKSHKPFYMKTENDKAICFDFLVPKVGELVGGSLRELDLKTALPWYNELREFNKVPHGGFGLGFERLIMFIMNLHSIREAKPFPRYYKHLLC
eukprot:NODE_2_length_91304_cov_0.692462.p19 type:complete len:408 gc:universal NODE_2_length_91304_cov_0.692462:773-1996(+)